MIRTSARFTRRILGTCLGVLLAVAATADEASPDTADLIDGLVARAGMPFSGRLKFEYETLPERDKEVSPKQVIDLAFLGPAWAKRYTDHDNVLINRDGFLATLTSTRRANAGGAEKKFVLRLESAKSLESGFANENWAMGVRLGTFLHSQQAQFVASHRSEAIDRGTAEIRGAPCRVLAWKVLPTDYDEAFLTIPDAVVETRGGFLVVYIAPTLGYALPRYDYESLKGEIGARVEADDFQKAAPGCFMPGKVLLTTTRSDGTKHVERFLVSKIESCNAELAPDLFDIPIPEGTQVWDRRPGMPVRTYGAGPASTLDSIAGRAAK